MYEPNVSSFRSAIVRRLLLNNNAKPFRAERTKKTSVIRCLRLAINQNILLFIRKPVNLLNLSGKIKKFKITFCDLSDVRFRKHSERSKTHGNRAGY